MIHALPGMGADHRMYPEPWSSLPEFAAHDWPDRDCVKILKNIRKVMEPNSRVIIREHW